MGNILFPCAPAPKEQPQSIINLSETCVERLVREEKDSGRKSAAEELNIPEDLTEKEWMIKLKCLDDAHSNEYGLTIQCFYKLADELEGQIDHIRPTICDPDEVIQCLNKNKCCPIRCRSQMEKYIDCIDTFRINIIKEKIESERKEKRREEQEIVQEFLKNGN